jgi:mercuric ion transport protein
MTIEHDLATSARMAEPGPQQQPARVGWLSAGGILAGLAAASCCVLPFVLFVAGISGAWIANLTALEPYRFYFAGAAIACIGFGFYRLYRKPAAACAEDAYCARPASHRIAKIGLWSATVIIVIALASPYLIARWF